MKLINAAKKYGSKVVAAGALLVGFGAHAELPAGIATSLTSIQTDGLAMADLVWPIVIVLSGAVILFKLYKRFIGKV